MAELLITKGYQVYGLVHRSSSSNISRISHLSNNVQILSGDLLAQCPLMDAIAQSQPDEIYNLASQSYVPLSWIQPLPITHYQKLRSVTGQKLFILGQELRKQFGGKRWMTPCAMRN